MTMKTWLIMMAALLLGCAGTAHADDAAPAKLALIINQVDYQTLTPLPDTDTEAAEMKAALVKVGFDVTSVRDANSDGAGGHPNLKQVIKDFRRKLAASPGAIGFVYYTGHGMADPTDDKGDNYLLAIDADIKIAADLPSSGIKLGDLMDGMAGTDAKAVIIVVDACRNTPSIGKSASKGLVAVAADPNTLVAYSTDLGDIAGVGVYAPVLAAELVKPGKTVTQVFDAVQVTVARDTGRQQKPWSNNRIYDTICLAGCDAGPAAFDINRRDELAVWAGARDCQGYKDYVFLYPEGQFAADAQRALASDTCAPAAGKTLAGAPKVLTAAQDCDLKAATEYDADRPAGSAFTSFFDLTTVAGAPAAAIAACTPALAADPGNRHLMFNLGHGYEAAKDYARARQLYSQAADAGNAAAMYRMGVLYSDGEGVTANPALQIRWWERSAAAGNPEAMINLGLAYSIGLNVPVDTAKSRSWYEMAAAAGDVDAQKILDGMPKP